MNQWHSADRGENSHYSYMGLSLQMNKEVDHDQALLQLYVMRWVNCMLNCICDA